MAPWEASRVLEALGLSSTEATVYKNLLLNPGTTVAEISHAVGIGTEKVRRVLADLEAKGLVSRAPGRAQRFNVPPPDLALEALATLRDGELKKARLEIDALLRELPGLRARHHSLPPVDLVSGLEAARQRWTQIQRGAKEEVCIIDRPPHIMTPTAPNPVELELLDKGIRYRLLYEGSSLDLPGRFNIARRCVEAGEQARVADGLPLKLVLADGQTALTYDVQGGEITDGLVVHASPLLDALVRLFEVLWDSASPFLASPLSDVGGLDETDRAILALLAAGAQDAVISRRLGLGARTVGRRVGQMMDAIGAKTRFQLALMAKDSEWL